MFMYFYINVFQYFQLLYCQIVFGLSSLCFTSLCIWIISFPSFLCRLTDSLKKIHYQNVQPFYSTSLFLVRWVLLLEASKKETNSCHLACPALISLSACIHVPVICLVSEIIFSCFHTTTFVIYNQVHLVLVDGGEPAVSLDPILKVNVNGRIGDGEKTEMCKDWRIFDKSQESSDLVLCSGAMFSGLGAGPLRGWWYFLS